MGRNMQTVAAPFFSAQDRVWPCVVKLLDLTYLVGERPMIPTHHRHTGDRYMTQFNGKPTLIALMMITGIATMLLVACGNDQDSASEASMSVDPEPSEELAFLPIHSEALHDLPIPELGQFRVEIEGEVHEGAPQCRMSMFETPGAENPRFYAYASWQMNDGSAMSVYLERLVYHDRSVWRQVGHVREIVRFQNRPDGNRNRVAQSDSRGTYIAWMTQSVPRPDSAPELYSGSAEFPAIRIARDEALVTMLATVEPADGDKGEQAYRGEIRLALHCEY